MLQGTGRRWGRSRWLALAISLLVYSILGQVYGFGAFQRPMGRLLGITRPVPADWRLPALGWIPCLAIASLGLAAALGAAWVGKAGPRKALLASAGFLAAGLLVAALGVRSHSLALVHVGYGLLAGIGMGLGYLAPLETLLAWFPARPGLASGLAALAFGGGGVAASSLAQALMAGFRTSTSMGVWETFLALAVLDLALLLPCAFLLRLPPAGLGRARRTAKGVGSVLRTRAFWFLWCMFFFLATAGFGVLGQAGALARALFPGRSVLWEAGAFVGFLGLFNAAGPLLWAGLSDLAGRKATYGLLLGLGAALLALAPFAARRGGIGICGAAAALLVTVYAGGFAALPAYARDCFGPERVRMVHGRLLSAWSAAALAGPALVTRLREIQVEHGVTPERACLLTLHLMAWLMVLGFLFNHNLGGAPAQERTVP